MTAPQGGNDIVFGAEVDDRTLEFFNRFDRNVERLATISEQGFDRVENAIDDAGPRIGILAGLVGGLTAKMVEFGVQGLNAIKQFVSGSIQLTARADVLATVLSNVGAQAGYSAEEIAEAEESVKAMGITTIATRQSLLRMTRANIDWSEAATLARIAQDAAVVAGINSSQAFDRLVTGIQKQEPELLDELGLTLNRTDAYDRLAQTLGKTTKQLTEAEKQQAILNDIYRQAGVLSGNYTAAMETAGKQAGSMERHVEELQLSIGRAFQPAYAAQIEWMTGRLKEMREWFEKNAEKVEEFSIMLGKFTTLLLSWIEEIMKFAVRLPGIIEDMGTGLAKAINTLTNAMDEDTFEKSASNWTTTAKQAFGIFTVMIAETSVLLVEVIKIGLEGLEAMGQKVFHLNDAIKHIFTGNLGEAKEAWDAFREEDAMGDFVANFGDRWEEAKDKARSAGNAAMSNWLNLMDTSKDATEEAADDMTDSMTSAADEMAAAFEAARMEIDKTMQGLADRLQSEALERQIKEQRRQIEEEQQLSWRREDIEREHQERMTEIETQGERDRQEMIEEHSEQDVEFAEKAAERRLNLEKAKSDRLISIEQQYRDRLDDIQTNYERNADEAARARDANALRQLAKQRKQQLEDADKGRERSRRDIQKDYEDRQKELEEQLAKEKTAMEEAQQEQLDNLDESLRKQIQKAGDARDKQYRDLERSLERQKIIRDMHQGWEEEDRQRALDKELEEIGKQFQNIEGLTEESLGILLEKWEDYFGDLSAIFEGYTSVIASQAEYLLQAGNPNTGPYDMRNWRDDDDNDMYDDYEERRNRGQANIGQAGQLSSILTSMASRGDSLNMNSSLLSGIGQVPPVAPSSSTDRREIVVKGDIAGMDPHIQRVLVNTLIELERNRGTAKRVG